MDLGQSLARFPDELALVLQNAGKHYAVPSISHGLFATTPATKTVAAAARADGAPGLDKRGLAPSSGLRVLASGRFGASLNPEPFTRCSVLKYCLAVELHVLPCALRQAWPFGM